ncbi:hypothetical protein OG352_29185 [Streptomyces sp. NBC_01485]|uniref:hypothetical protein n=1 Tax=Streptomyces sp. NBC_01485 TaxID=2903884 RepID=UPI002E314B9C|nr:hypothetical protein [Streptomyces sp. NBC_01485]
MRTELVSEAGDRAHANEDFASVGLPASGQGGSLVLLDGVTPPRGGAGCLHSVPWFTARLGGALTELTVSLPDVPLAEALAIAIARTAAAHSETCDLSHPRTPQATVALARWSPETVECLVLCDATLLLASPGGAVTPVRDDRLTRLPPALLGSADVVDGTLRNKEGGFFTAAADPSVAARAVTAAVPRGEVHALAALSDGAARWTELFHEGDWPDLFALVREEGAPALVERVRALERADDGAGRAFLGRAKTHDDATVVCVELLQDGRPTSPSPG